MHQEETEDHSMAVGKEGKVACKGGPGTSHRLRKTVPGSGQMQGASCGGQTLGAVSMGHRESQGRWPGSGGHADNG